MGHVGGKGKEGVVVQCVETEKETIDTGMGCSPGVPTFLESVSLPGYRVHNAKYS